MEREDVWSQHLAYASTKKGGDGRETEVGEQYSGRCKHTRNEIPLYDTLQLLLEPAIVVT
jgi:hypothetical protein